LTGRRKRGLVLRPDVDLTRADLPVLAETAAFPQGGNYGNAAPIAPD
jgi:hypothetical protein